MKHLLPAAMLIVICAGLSGCRGPKARTSTGAQFDDLPSAGKSQGARSALEPNMPGNAAEGANDAAPAPVRVVNQVSPELLRAPSDYFTLGPGDRVEIEIFGQATTRTTATVGPDGKLYYYLLPGLDVWGLTLAQTQQLIEQELSKVINAPQVGVNLREVASKHVWLLGRLNRPGIYPMPGPISLLEGIALAGGTARSASQISSEELADLRHSFVMRDGQLLPVDFHRLLREGDTSQNIYLRADDFVFVPSALDQEVYVLGAVRSPRAVPYTENMTVASAVAGSEGAVRYDWLQRGDGGLLKDAYLSHVTIVRGSLAQPEVTIVNLGAIMKGRQRDVRLEPGDIVYVPNSPFRYLKSYVNMIVNTFVTTVAANEGIRAGGGGQNISISVPVR